MIKKFLLFITGTLLFLSFFSVHTHGFLGEDLGLDLYKSIDEGFEELEIKQYQYEISGQGQDAGGRIMEHVNSILEANGVQCEIQSLDDIELIADASDEQINTVYKRCKPKNSEDTSKETKSGNLSPTYIKKVISEVRKVRASLKTRAEEKSKQIYEIARIGLYSDGVSENSPFDLITDIEEIDRVIFSEELEYIGEDYGSLDFGDELDAFIAGDDRIADAPYNRDRETEELEGTGSEETPDPEGSASGEEEEDIGDIIENLDEDGNPILDTLDGHVYACYQDRNENGFDETTQNWLTDNIYTSGSDIESLIERSTRSLGSLGDIDNRTRARIGVPIESRDLEAKARFGPGGSHSRVYDNFDCDSFFCITVGFVTKQQNLFGAGGGGQTVSVESVLEKLDEHLDHFTKTSLIQSKMTTNNFEIGLLIPNLGDMLRGFAIQIQSKPAPILNIDNSEREAKNFLLGDIFHGKNLVKAYYKNLGLDYNRANDLSLFTRKIIETKAIQDSAELAINRSVQSLDIEKRYMDSLRDENEIISQAIDNKIANDDLQDFHTQFVELERFTLSMEDFVLGVSGAIQEMKKIPTQKP